MCDKCIYSDMCKEHDAYCDDFCSCDEEINNELEIDRGRYEYYRYIDEYIYDWNN